MNRPEPSDDRQRAIAEAIDSGPRAGDSSYGQIVADVAEAVPFCMSVADVQFLLDYAHWRFPQPKMPLVGRTLKDDLKRSR